MKNELLHSFHLFYENLYVLCNKRRMTVY